MARRNSMARGWRLHHVGVVVSDLDRAISYYKSLGIVDRISTLMTSEGKKAKLIGRMVGIGNLNLEFWQPIRGDTVQQEFLDSNGEGINHLAFSVDNYDEAYNLWFAEKGIRFIFGSRPPPTPQPGGGGYFDLRKGHNTIFELIHLPPGHDVVEWEL
ncbi:MAG: VOC family protein [Dehalococcoidia bacterium]|nr:VOC family protein [Dehalococcoidia bacterium]